MSATLGTQFISVQPDELKFQFELERQSYCDLKVVNNTEYYVAFKVKTTSPKKYFVRPNTGVLQPWDSSIIRVTLQAQHEYPPDMQCKDKFLLQSTTVPQSAEVDDLPQDTFTKESGRPVQDCKLKVVYISPSQGNTDYDSSRRSPDGNSSVQQLRDEIDAIFQQTLQLQQELDMWKRRKQRKSELGFSFKFALFVGLIGIMVGFLLNLSLSSPAAE